MYVQIDPEFFNKLVMLAVLTHALDELATSTDDDLRGIGTNYKWQVDTDIDNIFFGDMCAVLATIRDSRPELPWVLNGEDEEDQLGNTLRYVVKPVCANGLGGVELQIHFTGLEKEEHHAVTVVPTTAN